MTIMNSFNKYDYIIIEIISERNFIKKKEEKVQPLINFIY